MDSNEMKNRLKGAANMGHSLIVVYEKMSYMFGHKMKKEDKETLKELLSSIMSMLEQKYKREIDVISDIKK